MLKAKGKSAAKSDAKVPGASLEKKQATHHPTAAEHLEFSLQGPQFKPTLIKAENQPHQQILLGAVHPLTVQPTEENVLHKAQTIHKYPHRNIRQVLSVVKHPTKASTVYLAESPQHSITTLKSLPDKLRVCQSLVDALIHLRNLRLLFLDLHEQYFTVSNTTNNPCIDCFYKSTLKADSPEWNRIRAPQLVNQKLAGGVNHDYSSADVWSFANFLVGVLWDPSKRLSYSTTDADHKYFISGENILQSSVQLTLPDLKVANSSDLIRTLEKCLSFNPRKRPPLQAIQYALEEAMQPTKQPYNSLEHLVEEMHHLKSTSHTPNHLEPALLSSSLVEFVSPHLEHLVKKSAPKFTLVYQASSMQFRSDLFHRCCDKLNHLLVVCQATNGKLFGGFSSDSWEGKNGLFGCYRPSTAVLFSFSNRTIHRLKIKQHAIGCQPSLGPVFGTADLVIGDCNINNICMFPLAYKQDQPNHLTPDALSLTGGRSFTLVQYEVYSVKFQA